MMGIILECEFERKFNFLSQSCDKKIKKKIKKKPLETI